MRFFFFIFPFLTSSQPSLCRLDCWLSYLSHQHFLEVFVGSCKAKCYCSGITSTLMQPGVSCRAFNAAVTTLFSDISQLSFVLSLSDVYPCQLDCLVLDKGSDFWPLLCLAVEVLLLKQHFQLLMTRILPRPINLYAFINMYLSLDYLMSSGTAHNPIPIFRPSISTISILFIYFSEDKYPSILNRKFILILFIYFDKDNYPSILNMKFIFI